MCLASVSGHHCGCKSGYSLADDGHSCIDIDECSQTPLPCSHKCYNTVPHYQCTCADGFKPKHEGKQCIASSPPEPYLLFTNRNDIRKITLDSSDYTELVSNLQNTIAIDYHYQSNLLFWSDITSDKIYSSYLNGSNLKVIISAGLVSPGGLTIDWQREFIFWTDSGTSRIELAKLDGSNRKVLFWKNVEKPRAIVVNPSQSTLYWTDWGKKPRIEKSFMDGSGREQIVYTSLFWPNGLTIDYPGERLYWSDAKNHVIESSNLDGENRRTIIHGESLLPHPFAITIFEDTIYWTDWHDKSIHSADKLTGLNVKLIHDKLHFPMGLTIVHPLKQAMSTASNTLDSPNSDHHYPPHPHHNSKCDTIKCSHLCLANNVSYTCSCPTGYVISDDGINCATKPGTMMLFTRRNDIYWMCVQCSSDENEIDSVLSLRNLTSAVQLDWDFNSLTVFWTDVSNDTINRVNWDGSDQTVIVSLPLDKPSGLSVDWIAQNLYWSDSGRNVIETAKFNGQYRSILIWIDLDRPRDVCVDSSTGLMFWINRNGLSSKIERSGMDASNRVVIITSNLTWTQGLTLDIDEKHLYWADINLKLIEYCDYEGYGRTRLMSTNVRHPLGLSIYERYLYWSDWESKTITRTSKYNSDDSKVLLNEQDNVMDVEVFHSQRPNTSNPCLHSKCQQLCLISPSKSFSSSSLSSSIDSLSSEYSCYCSIGLPLLDDGYSCAQEIHSFIIIASRTSIRKISLDVDYFADILLPIESNYLLNTLILDIYPEQSYVYWSDTYNDKIYRARYDLPSYVHDNLLVEEIIVHDLHDVNGMTIDWIGEKLYWSDAERKRIEVSNLDGSSRRVLIWQDLESPRYLTVHYQSGLMFWTDWGSTIKIYRADMDGTRKVLIVGNNLGWINGISVYQHHQASSFSSSSSSSSSANTLFNDIMSSSSSSSSSSSTFSSSSSSSHDPSYYSTLDYKIIWLDSKLHTLEMCDTNGANRHVIMNNLAAPYGLTVLDGYIYWTDWETRSIHRIKGINPSSKEKIISGINNIADIRGFNMINYESNKPINVCKINRADCSHLCLRNSWGYSCSCPTGLPLMSDKKTCQPNMTTFLLFASKQSIRRISLEDPSTNTSFLDTYLPISEVNNAVAIDYDFGNQYIYFSDVSLQSIRKANFNGNSVVNIVNNNLITPDGLAFDWVAKNLYFSDTGRNVIEVCRDDGSSRRIVIDLDLDEPRALAVYPRKGLLFWTDWGDLPKIEKSYLDGSSRNLLISRDLGWPNGITIDYEMDLIYWVDAQLDRIECSDLNGDLRRVIIQKINHPFGLTIYGEHLYWTDWHKKAIERVNKQGFIDDKRLIVDNIEHLMDIKMVSPSRQPGKNCLYLKCYSSSLIIIINKLFTMKMIKIFFTSEARKKILQNNQIFSISLYNCVCVCVCMYFNQTQQFR